MQPAFRALSATAVLAVAAIALSGCAFLPSHKAQDEFTLSDAVTTVRIEGNNGDVTVEGVVGAAEISIEREFVYRGNKRDFGPTTEVKGSELVLSGCGNQCMVSYTVELPPGVDVSGRTENGSIELTAVNNVEVASDNGRISLDEVAGTIVAATSNGRIDGEDLAGPRTTVTTSNGSIELELAEAQPVQATTSNGSIMLRVPDSSNESYAVHSKTSNGAENISIDNSSSGTNLLELETSNGSITVKSASNPSD